ncbi:MAG: single-stranded DNA-binding protein [Nocardioidaceae bacterium]|nr:single-stranded DNA-binding protein [Nocardioidaceae bacterium]
MSETAISMIGHVGTDVDYRKVGSGTDLSTFRFATTPRRWDRNQRQYVDGTTSWISVQCWRALAVHVKDSVRRGDPVIVVGKLKTEEWTKDGVRNSRFVLEAVSMGHDLNRGISTFHKVARQVEAPVDEVLAATEALQEIEAADAIGAGDFESDASRWREAS